MGSLPEEGVAMPILEDVKHIAEKITGLGRPNSGDIRIRKRKAHTFKFRDDGQTPNNPHFPLIVYRTPVELGAHSDPAAVLEVLFASNGWRGSWRDGVYGFLHFHTGTHEVLGIARGWVRVKFGGAKGRMVELRAGDVAVLPAGTGHCRKAASQDLLVVGAYPPSGDYDEPKPRDVDPEKARKSIAKVSRPRRDPVYGSNGPLLDAWRRGH
jgi:uncharacterized protein YjlB